jgi:hypothetical protein
MYASALAICLYYFVHEGGHWLFGFIYNLSQGAIAKFEITSWVSVPLFPLSYLKLPQQTTIVEGTSSLFFVYGGMLFGLVVVFLIFHAINNRLDGKRKIFSVLIPITFIIFELIGNFLCGTDNPLARPILSCENNALIWMVENIFFLLIIPIFAITYDKVEAYTRKFIDFIERSTP